MSWNYRVCKKLEKVHDEFGPLYTYAFHEVYYNPDGTIWAITENPVTIVADRLGESELQEPESRVLEEMSRSLNYMMLALRERVIDFDNITFAPKQGEIDDAE